jgi:large subunit ribosomal protein L21
MKYAIVESGGKQYKAVEGSAIEVDRLSNQPGDQVTLDTVLLVVEDDRVLVGKPTVKGAQVKTTVEEHIKGKKIVVFKYRPKKRIRVKTGHRQQYTRLKVDSILVE